ncbi:hypothetical protein FRC06_003273 [Ceratobasidium sp. 370]|nr:hypothetical protein FRC06_003273 [Ceratobasidium sp. 370]
MSEDMFGSGINPGLNSGLGGPNMNSDLAKQMSLLSAAGRLRATSAAGQQQQRGMGMAPPVPPNVPDKQRAQFIGMLSQVLASRGLILPPFVTGQPNPAWVADAGPLKNVQPATDGRPGALRMPGAAPGRSGDIDLFKLWSAVTGAGGMQRITAAGQWENVAAHIGLQLPPSMPGSTHSSAAQLAQLYFVLMSPLEEHMKRSAQAKHAQMLAAQQQLQNQNQNPSANPGVQQQPLTPAQMHQQQQNNQAPGLGSLQASNMGVGGMQTPNMGANLGMQPPGLGGMQNPGLAGMQNAGLSGMQGMGGMQPSNLSGVGGMQNPGMGGMQNQGMNVNMTPAQMHQQQQAQGGVGMSGQGGMGGQPQAGPMLTPAQMHAMGSGGMGAGVGGGLGAVGAGLGAGVGVGAGLGGGAGGGLGGAGAGIGAGLGVGGTMPPPAPMIQPQPDAGLGMGLGLGGGLGVGGGKRKSEPDEDEKRAKVKVGDPAASTPVPTSATPAAGPPPGPPRRTKIEYVPLRLDVETFGGRALDSMLATGGTMERPVRDISELGIVDISSLTLCLRARTPKALAYALGTLAVLSAHAQQSFPLVRCEDLVDALVEVLEGAAWEGENWAGGVLGGEVEVKYGGKDENPDGQGTGDWDESEDVPIRTHRELVRVAAEMGLGMRAKGRAWDGNEVAGRGVKVEEREEEGDVKMDGVGEVDSKRSYMDVAPPGIARSDVIITIVRLLRNFSIGTENCIYMAREGSKVVDVLASLVGFREGKRNPREDEDPLGFVGDGLWENGVEVSITPLSSALTLPQLLRIRKDVLHTISNLAPHIRLSASSSTPRELFSLLASFLLDPADTRSPIQLYQHLPQRRFSLTTDLALDALTRIAQLDLNRSLFQRTVPPVLLRASFGALVKMLPAEPNDMLLVMRAEHWMAYAERVALALYALACCAPGSVRRDIRAQRTMGAAVLRMMCRLAQYDPAASAENKVGAWTQRNPFACLVRRVIEALRVIDEPEEGGGGEVIGWPVRGVKVEGEKGSGWLAGIGADDALLMMVIEGMDPVTFEDLEVLTRLGEVTA